jgi:hypothetical protein
MPIPRAVPVSSPEVDGKIHEFASAITKAQIAVLIN